MTSVFLLEFRENCTKNRVFLKHLKDEMVLLNAFFVYFYFWFCKKIRFFSRDKNEQSLSNIESERKGGWQLWKRLK